VDNVGAVDQSQGFPDIVISDENTDTALFQVLDEKLNVADGNRIDSGERFVEEHEGGTAGQGARDFAAPAVRRRRARSKATCASAGCRTLSSKASSSAARLRLLGSMISRTARILSRR